MLAKTVKLLKKVFNLCMNFVSQFPFLFLEYQVVGT